MYHHIFTYSCYLLLVIRSDTFQLEHLSVPINASTVKGINTMEWLITIATVSMMILNEQLLYVTVFWKTYRLHTNEVIRMSDFGPLWF